MAKAKVIRKLTVEVRVKLSSGELLERGELLAKALATQKQIEDEVAQERRRQTIKVKDAAKLVEKLSDAIRDKAEMRPIECEERVAAGKFMVVRLDTGEVVDERHATLAETQDDLPGMSEPPGGNMLAKASGKEPAADHTPEPNEDGDVIPDENEGAKPKSKRKRKR